MEIRWNYNRPGWIALAHILRVRDELAYANAGCAVIDKLTRIARYIVDSSDDDSIEFVP